MGARTFLPVASEVVDSGRMPGVLQYRVAIGYEDWGSSESEPEVVLVRKVQVVKNGRVHGRKAPSYPDADWTKVCEAMQRVELKVARQPLP